MFGVSNVSQIYFFGKKHLEKDTLRIIIRSVIPDESGPKKHIGCHFVLEKTNFVKYSKKFKQKNSDQTFQQRSCIFKSKINNTIANSFSKRKFG